MTSNVQYIECTYPVVTYSTYILFWLFLASYVAFGAHNLGRNYKKEDRFLYVGIVDKKSKMELEIPAPPSLTTKKTT